MGLKFALYMSVYHVVLNSGNLFEREQESNSSYFTSS